MFFLFFVLGLFFSFLTARAALVNVTIDDTPSEDSITPRIVYTPANAWRFGPTCNDNCEVYPDGKQLVNGTWHDSEFSVNNATNGHPDVPLTASVSFNGSAVYVFCAILRKAESDMTFYMDGVIDSNFTRPATDADGFDYGVPVFATDNLHPGQHTLTIQNGHQNGPDSVMILDAIIFSTDDSVTLMAAPQASASAAALTGSGAQKTPGPSGTTLAVAGVLIFALLAIFVSLSIFLYRRRRRRRAVYARYMPEGSVQAFPSFLAPSGASTPVLAPLPPAYAGSAQGNWWVGRDQKGSSYRPYADLDPSQAGLQRPQGWERTTPV